MRDQEGEERQNSGECGQQKEKIAGRIQRRSTRVATISRWSQTQQIVQLGKGEGKTCNTLKIARKKREI